MITSGELRRFIEEDGLKGVTSNPAIFEKAIAGSDDYDEDIQALARQNKSVEDIYEAIATTIPGSRFGLAFSEASGPRLVRSDGTDLELKQAAEQNLLRLGCGHCFLVVLGDAYPIQVLNAIRAARRMGEIDLNARITEELRALSA